MSKIRSLRGVPRQLREGIDAIRPLATIARVGVLQTLILVGLSVPTALQRPVAVARTAQASEVGGAKVPFIDVHTHFDPTNPAASAQTALRTMKDENASRLLFMPPPFTVGSANRYDDDVLSAVNRGNEKALRFLGGGGTLNAMIEQSVQEGTASPKIREQFRAHAEEILRRGAVGFGEMAAEHFATVPGADYEYAPPDHPLFLLLADISAEHGGIPIDLHMEAVPEAMPIPAEFNSPPNPPHLRENIRAFERFLDHNRQAPVVWAHAGCDYSGYRTTKLMRLLLRDHPNLYMEIKIDPSAPGKNTPLDDSGKVRPDWLELFRSFSDRFVIGSDQHYPEPSTVAQRWQPVVALLNQLPADLQRKIGKENAERIYHLAAGTTGNN